MKIYVPFFYDQSKFGSPTPRKGYRVGYMTEQLLQWKLYIYQNNFIVKSTEKRNNQQQLAKIEEWSERKQESKAVLIISLLFTVILYLLNFLQQKHFLSHYGSLLIFGDDTNKNNQAYTLVATRSVDTKIYLFCQPNSLEHLESI